MQYAGRTDVLGTFHLCRGTSINTTISVQKQNTYLAQYGAPMLPWEYLGRWLPAAGPLGLPV